MKKFMNQPETFVDDMLRGIYAAYPRQLDKVGADLRCLVRKDRKPGKVGIVTGGGSGHLPLFLGYVGEGMLDGCAVGGVFQSPSADQILETTKAVDGGKGVLYLYGNYTGDIINFDMAGEMAEMEDIRTMTVLGADDVASAPADEGDKRRGVAGIFFAYKAAGAKAAQGAELEEVHRVAQKAASSVRTMGVALSPCIVPEVGKPSFILGEDEMEIGMGIHGEPGIRRGQLKSAKETVLEMLEPVLQDLGAASGDEVSVLVNGLGATCQEELYIIFGEVAQILEARGVKLHSTYVGEYATSMEMMGFSLSVCKLDDELRGLLEKPADTPFFTQMDRS